MDALEELSDLSREELRLAVVSPRDTCESGFRVQGSGFRVFAGCAGRDPTPSTPHPKGGVNITLSGSLRAPTSSVRSIMVSSYWV